MKSAIPFQNIASIPLLVKDYLSQNEKAQFFYDLPISLENILQKSKEKQTHFSHRNLVVKQLEQQNAAIELSLKQKQNLHYLENEKTFTITTGHQLNFLTGPVFFIYKILQTVKTCEELNQFQKEFTYVPIFWMASEDHDFEEINHFNYKGKKYQWETKEKGSVGRFHLESFYKNLDTFIAANPEWESFFNSLNSKIYSCKTLAEFTRLFVNELFKDYGLLIIDGDDSQLKQSQIFFYTKELLQQNSYYYIQKTNEKLKKSDYKIQVNPREINLFYSDENGRNRIELYLNNYKIINTQKQFSQKEMLIELENSPEKFSPNALLRPLYQETILPNVAYIGGNAEICYWLQLKSLFESENIPFPILIPRNSFFILKESQYKKMQKLGWNIENLFQPKNEIIEKNIKQNLQVNIDFCENKRKIQALYLEMKKEAEKTDVSLLNLLNAQEYRQLKAFDAVQKRLIKAEKIKNKELIERIEKLYVGIFPNLNWQEREVNFLEFCNPTPTLFFEMLYKSILPFDAKCFSIIFDY